MREGHIMGVYEEEQRRIAEGTAQRGQAALDYFAELDARLVDENGIPVEESLLAHRPDYSKTLFALENDDIYQEFCRFLDQPEPRYFDTLDNQIEIEGYTAKDIYVAMKGGNQRIVTLDGAAVYNMLVKLRKQPAIAKKVLEFRPTCYQGGCNSKDAAYVKGLYSWQKEEQE